MVGATKSKPTAQVERIAATLAIARATGIPSNKESRRLLRQGLRDAVEYAQFAAAKQLARESHGKRSLDSKVRRIEKTARALEAALADADARYEVGRNLPIGEPDLLKAGLDHLIEAASITTNRMKPRRQHAVHQVWFLTKVAKAIVAAGGRFPTYNKNTDGGTWRQVIDALRDELPPTFLNVSPSVLASWTKKAREAALK